MATAMVRCALFLLCENEATGVVPHPILDYVPCCSSCAEKLGYELLAGTFHLGAEQDDSATFTFACSCRGYDSADPCGHGDTSQGCLRHDPQARADALEEGRQPLELVYRGDGRQPQRERQPRSQGDPPIGGDAATAPKLTARQRAALEALGHSPVALTPLELGELLGTTAEGAAATAGSLVRRGLVVRRRHRGRVAYVASVAP